MFREFRIDMRCDGQMCASNMRFNSNLGEAHIVGDFGVGVTGSVRKIDLSRPPAHGVQNARELIRTLLAIQNLIRSGACGYQRVLPINVVDLNFPAHHRTIATMVIDRQAAYGVSQKCFLINDYVVLCIYMEVQHGFLDQIVRVFVGFSFTP